MSFSLSLQRSTLEQKLAESRQQLTEVKSSWSDKIALLEQQVRKMSPVTLALRAVCEIENDFCKQSVTKARHT